ncbi:hypothetical protein M413DRAFT_33179 [Hebeloma cylindrosporum]|uniref:Uncharacterized protein n=1 Tax=Hebeloma cylindrosporum TaxID=76867 RepID=A0A0C3BTC6_HEBCY|nr:hypothetical protein M413DRAFT_33179 [Hebeloma cylindrosporum h7]
MPRISIFDGVWNRQTDYPLHSAQQHELVGIRRRLPASHRTRLAFTAGSPLQESKSYATRG